MSVTQGSPISLICLESSWEKFIVIVERDLCAKKGQTLALMGRDSVALMAWIERFQPTERAVEGLDPVSKERFSISGKLVK